MHENEFFEKVERVDFDNYVLVEFIGKVKLMIHVAKCVDQDVTVNFEKRGKYQLISPAVKDKSVV